MRERADLVKSIIINTKKSFKKSPFRAFFCFILSFGGINRHVEDFEMIEIKDLSLTLKDLEGEKEILKNINLSFHRKKIYVITGPNGGGKSSLAKAIMGIYKATSGQILLDGVDITDMKINERANLGIGYGFQQPPRFKGIKVSQLLDMAGGGKVQNPCDLLYDVGLCAQDYLDRELNATFSGGELKRVEIASILAKDLKVAIFDEPEAGIDLWSFQKLSETFENMNRNHDTTIIIISHQDRIIKLADQVIVLEDGMVSDITTKEKILSEIELIDTDCRCRQNCDKGGRAIAGCDR